MGLIHQNGEWKLDSLKSATKHLLRALDDSWVLEDAELMQLIADALDRSEQLGQQIIEAKQELTETSDQTGLATSSYVQKDTDTRQADHVREITSQIIELYDPGFAAIYEQWTTKKDLAKLLELAGGMEPELLLKLVTAAKELAQEEGKKAG